MDAKRQQPPAPKPIPVPSRPYDPTKSLRCPRGDSEIKLFLDLAGPTASLSMDDHLENKLVPVFEARGFSSADAPAMASTAVLHWLRWHKASPEEKTAAAAVADKWELECEECCVALAQMAAHARSAAACAPMREAVTTANRFAVLATED